MELKASKVISALDYLQNLAQHPLQSVSSKNRTIIDEVRKSYLPHKNSKNTGKKRKQSPSSKTIGPKPKRQRTTRSSTKRTHNNHTHLSSKAELSQSPLPNTHPQSQSQSHSHSDTDSDQYSEEEIETDSSLDENIELIEDYAHRSHITGDSPSHFTHFPPSKGVFIANKHSLSPLWSRGEPRHNDLDSYLQSIGKIFYRPIEAMDSIDLKGIKPKKQSKRHRNTNHKKAKETVFRYSAMNLILSPLRKRSPFDEWNPREIALFESGMCSKGKNFYEISKIIGSKNTKQCVEFYYFWKQSSHYSVWKALGRQTKKAMKKSHKKLHEKIGRKFAEFHRRNIALTARDTIKLPSLTETMPNSKENSTNAQTEHESNNGNNLVVYNQAPPQSGSGVQQPMGIIQYYPSYYANNGYGNGYSVGSNGYPWYSTNMGGYHYTQPYNAAQQTQAQVQGYDTGNGKVINNSASVSESVGMHSGLNVDGMGGVSGNESDFIDLTETEGNGLGNNNKCASVKRSIVCDEDSNQDLDMNGNGNVNVNESVTAKSVSVNAV